MTNSSGYTSREHYDVARQCIRYIALSSCIDDWEFSTRLGFDRQDLIMLLNESSVLTTIENGTMADEVMNNCFNEVCNGLRIDDAEWSRWFSVTRKDVRNAYTEWQRR